MENVFTKLMVLLSVAYGITLAILGYLGTDNIGLIAMIGALAIGFLWVAYGLFGRKSSSSSSKSTSD